MRRWTPNQVVAYNLWGLRNLHGWTQEEAAERLEPYLGERWSRVVFSAAERSVAGQRIRQFSADDLTAFAAAFEVPVSYFFQPPPASFATDDGLRDHAVDAVDEIAPPKASRALTPRELMDDVARRPYEDPAVVKLVAAAEQRERTRITQIVGTPPTEREEES